MKGISGFMTLMARFGSFARNISLILCDIPTEGSPIPHFIYGIIVYIIFILLIIILYGFAVY